MIDFEYAAPTELEEAIGLLRQHGDRARVLAGGTDIIVQLREHLRSADLVVDVKKITALMQYHYSAEQGLRLGASVPCWRIYGDAAISQAYPALAEATHIIGGWQIQSRASVGGNLCNASPAADSIPPLIVQQATAEITGPQGQRTLPVEQFCVAPGRNALTPGELLVAIHIPPAVPHSSSAYQRFIPRNEMDIAVVGVASWVQLDPTGQRIEQARIALAAVAPTPLLAAEASQWLAGQPATEATFARASELAQQVATPISDMRGTAEYRRHLVGVLTRRTLAIAVARARGE